MRGRRLPLAFAAILLMGCASQPSQPIAEVIQLDLSALDVDGLRGPPGGKVAVAYEFCIPDTDAHRIRVREIDPSIQFMGDSPGRIGCTDTQCLCIGSTHQPSFRDILNRLAALSYVREIRRCNFE